MSGTNSLCPSTSFSIIVQHQSSHSLGKLNRWGRIPWSLSRLRSFLFPMAVVFMLGYNTAQPQCRNRVRGSVDKEQFFDRFTIIDARSASSGKVFRFEVYVKVKVKVEVLCVGVRRRRKRSASVHPLFITHSYIRQLSIKNRLHTLSVCVRDCLLIIWPKKRKLSSRGRREEP